ncbi:MAG TPA: DPP IV N-terminal domain-containing protein [Polyangiaceae bacterium]
MAPSTPAPVASASDYALHPSPYDPRAGGGADIEVIRQLAQTRSFRLGMPSDAHLTPDGKTVLFLRSPARDAVQSLWAMDLASGAARELVSPATLLAGPETLSPEERVRRERMRVRTRGFTSLGLSEDGARALVTLSGRVWVVDLATGKTTELATGLPGEGRKAGAAIDPHFSRDGKRVAFVRDDDLHVAPVDGGRATQVTRGGREQVTHGLAEFVAGEELDRHRGFWWSPDGAHLLYEEADTTHVDVLTIADPFHAEQPAQRIAYPRPGRTNADVRFGIVSSTGGATTWVQWDRTRFPYVAQASWPKGGPPLLYVLERLQRVGQLLAVDPATGKTRVLVEDRDDAWVNIDPSVPRWLADGSGFLWASDAGGPEWRLELRDAQGKLARSLLPAGFGYEAVADVDEKTRTAVIEASADPTGTSLWRVSLDGAVPPQRIGPERGETTAHFDESHAMFVAREESLESMPRVLVRSLDGSAAREIPSLAEAPKMLAGVEMEEVGPDHVRVAIVRPHGYRPDRRYAVIDAAYAGPHVTVVSQSALGYIRTQWMADATGAIVVSMDVRGTPRRGRDWERAIAGKLGTVPLEGHVATLEALGEKHPEMDMTRIGVFGWSFGGYFSALAVLARPDVYRVGAAGAPPADWRDYDTAYTERYLGLPQESAAAYDEASLLTYARKPVEGDAAARPLLVVHGTADDNVWFLNSLKLADALERAKRPFTLFPISGVTHMPLEEDLNESLWLRVADTLRDGLRAPD